jgi:hypothetical protein
MAKTGTTITTGNPMTWDEWVRTMDISKPERR